MLSSKRCACKGIRTCLLCEETCLSNYPSQCWDANTNSFAAKDGIANDETDVYKDVWYYCLTCRDKAYRIQSVHQEHTSCDEYINITGVRVFPDFISESEEAQIVSEMDKGQWVESQSGRKKQDFGPKVNFKRKKLKIGTFEGFPAHSKMWLDRMRTIDILASFKAVEMCNLEYRADRGAAIDAHFDDFWLWGERLVTINLLSHTYYTLTKPDSNIRIIVPLPLRSLIVLSADARYKWMHSIARQHITSRRIGITVRELTEEFLSGDSESIGKELLSIASCTVHSV